MDSQNSNVAIIVKYQAKRGVCLGKFVISNEAGVDIHPSPPPSHFANGKFLLLPIFLGLLRWWPCQIPNPGVAPECQNSYIVDGELNIDRCLKQSYLNQHHKLYGSILYKIKITFLILVILTPQCARQSS